MKSVLGLISVSVVVACSAATAADPPRDPIQVQLISPELLMQHREQVGLSESQVDRIRRHLEKTGSTAGAHQKKVEEETHKLADLLSKQDIDEGLAMKQLDKVLAAEAALKRLHLGLMIRIKGELTAEQRQLAATIQRKLRRDGLEQRMRSKLTRIEKEIVRRADAGEPPRDAIELMQAFQAAIQAGRHREAEALLDRVLKSLGLDKEKKPSVKQQGSLPNERFQAIAHLDPLSYDATLKHVKELAEENVAWRKIAWKTCLLDGLKASREQNKPLLLWIFIDRPIDDERC